MTGADAILYSLKENGIDYLFVNAGSDFAPLSKAMPRPMMLQTFHRC